MPKYRVTTETPHCTVTRVYEVEAASEEEAKAMTLVCEVSYEVTYDAEASEDVIYASLADV